LVELKNLREVLQKICKSFKTSSLKINILKKGIFLNINFGIVPKMVHVAGSENFAGWQLLD